MGDSAEWAKLESAGSCTVAEFITSLANEEETRYLFDWSLPLYAPELATELTIPKYFANDFLGWILTTSEILGGLNLHLNHLIA